MRSDGTRFASPDLGIGEQLEPSLSNEPAPLGNQSGHKR